MTPPAIRKVKLDTNRALDKLLDRSTEAAQNRFAKAASTIQRLPHGLSAETPAPGETDGASMATVPTIGTTGRGFNLAACVPGAVVRVPFNLIRMNPVGPRQIYRAEEIDKIAQTLPEGQDDAAHGFVQDDHVVLIDGGTRYRSAKVSGVAYLDVKFELPPKDDLELYLVARRYNEQRSQPSVIDHALSLSLLLEQGAVGNARELVEKVPDINGKGQMSESQVSMYLRIARIPRTLLERMAESAITSQYSVLYAISEIFPKDEKPTSDQIDLAGQLIDEIKSRDLTKKQVQDLVKSRLSTEPKRRERSVQQPIAFGPCKGHIKLFGKRGQLDLSLKGLSEDNLPLLQRELQALIERFASEHEKAK
ncbi:ParB/RepB/Spo0J family partition protein [Acidovorax sp. sic0104]|uniref:ParB/RepB/Spo0J family partition protein n=1 Tax=Acidovorax sp. sic0104 TaxID=2854784 RepID=UPI001C4539A7|nr:ParB/RepB/Spo0J family partition protein [Acidovorax sp. sic0104]MBV7542091.1 ParB/RepB/Spo0J family partition protein [Acidovorax sp. sic0104]